MEVDSGFLTRSCCCSVEWLTTYSNLVEYVQLLHNDDRNAVLLSISLLSPRVFNLFLIKLRGAPKIDLPLSMFLLVNSFLTTLFSVSILLAGETKIVALVEAILEEEKSYPKPV